MADPTLMVRFKRDGKWPRARAAYGMKGNPKQGWIVSGTDKNGNEISHELEALISDNQNSRLPTNKIPDATTIGQ